jgi:hypothetical protein
LRIRDRWIDCQASAQLPNHTNAPATPQPLQPSTNITSQSFTIRHTHLSFFPTRNVLLQAPPDASREIFPKTLFFKDR